MEFWQYAILFFAGIACGWINVLAGGGSSFTIPIMLFLGLSGPEANGTNRIAIIAQNVAAMWRFLKSEFREWRLSISLAAFASFGAVLGARLGVDLDGAVFDQVLAFVIILVMVMMLADTDKVDAKARAKSPAKNLVFGHLLMIGAGFWGGLIQVAVSFVMMPILYRIMGMDLVRTNIHKAFAILWLSIVSLVIFNHYVTIDWQAGFALAGGNALGGYIGAKTSMEGGSDFIKKAVGAMLAVVAIKLLFF